MDITIASASLIPLISDWMVLTHQESLSDNKYIAYNINNGYSYEHNYRNTSVNSVSISEECQVSIV